MRLSFEFNGPTGSLIPHALIFQGVRSKMFQQVMSNLESFVSRIKITPLSATSHEIPTAILLTGENRR